MPQHLAEIGHNVQRLPGNATDRSSRLPPKRHGLNKSGSPLLPISAKASPRFMAETFSSNSARRTPPPSRLPCRSLTPTLSTTMGSNGKTRNWVSSAANRIGIGRPEASNLPINAKDEVISERLTEMSHKKTLQSNAVHDKPLPSPPIAQIATSSPEAVGRSLIDASTPPLRHGPEESEPQDWPTLSPERPHKAMNMKNIAQKDPAEQFPVLTKSVSNGSLSSSASTVKVKRGEVKLMQDESDKYVLSPKHSFDEHIRPGSKESEVELNSHAGDGQLATQEDYPNIENNREGEKTNDQASDTNHPNGPEASSDDNAVNSHGSCSITHDTSSSESQIRADDGEQLGSDNSSAHVTSASTYKTDTSHNAVTPLIMVNEHPESLFTVKGESEHEESQVNSGDVELKRQSQATFQTCETSPDVSTDAAEAQSMIDPSYSPQSGSDIESLSAYHNDISDTLSTIYSAPSSAGSPVHNRLGQLKYNSSLPEQRCTPSNFSRLKPKSSSISLSVDPSSDLTDKCRVKRLSPHYAGGDCGPVLTVYEGADNTIMGGDEVSSASKDGRWSSCKKKLSYNATKRMSQPGCSARSSLTQGKSQFDFNFTNEEGSSDEQTLANYSLSASPELYPCTGLGVVGNNQQRIYSNGKIPVRASSLRSSTTSYEGKERPSSIGYPATTRPSTSGGTLGSAFPPRISSLSTNAATLTRGSVPKFQKAAIESPVVRINRQSLVIERSVSINSTTPKPPSVQSVRSASKARAAFSNIRGLFHRSPGSRKGAQRTLPAKTIKHFQADGKGSPLYSRSVPSHHQSNTAAKRLPSQRSNTSKAQTPPKYANKRAFSLSKDTEHEDSVRNGPESQISSIKELSSMIATILRNARQSNNAEEFDGLLAITQIIVQTITTAKACETNMIIATQAAREAEISYNMTQQKMKELTRLLKQSESFKKLLT